VQLGLTFVDKDHSFLEGEMAAKRKKKAKRKATKRKGAKRKATKRKATKRKATKRKATKRKATKRKATKRKGAKKKKKATKRKATKRKVKKKKATKRKAAKPKVTKKKKPAKKKAKKKKSKRKPNPAFMRPLQPDALLAAVVGSKPLPRTEVTKQLWHYIRKNGLQDSVNRRMINADANLKAIFNGKSQVSMFEMTKLVSRHMA
jgi:flagellar biosynthesis GTPase FlhF